ncbi:MAG: four helix bundle protein [Acidobacteriota bacterium]
MARGSLSELETHLLVALRLSYLRESPYAHLKARCDRVAAMLDGHPQAGCPKVRQAPVLAMPRSFPSPPVP